MSKTPKEIYKNCCERCELDITNKRATKQRCDTYGYKLIEITVYDKKKVSGVSICLNNEWALEHQEYEILSSIKKLMKMTK
jgi:hypothetical protein